jgi:bifunctional DNA-binding transcriptional regulator/antitoxin component of YhaV-PrlF toxin-antitoxin module
MAVMKWQARMLSKGRVTAPRGFLRALRARHGDSLEFGSTEGTSVHVKLARGKNWRKRKPF